MSDKRIEFSVLTSGSCGNSYIFSYDGTSILIDAGSSFNQLRIRSSLAGFDIENVSALFLTHLHPDHSHAAGMFARRIQKPVYVSSWCMKLCGNNEYACLKIPECCQHTIEPESPVQIGPFRVKCFYTSHDSGGSCGYSILAGRKLVTIITDTGTVSDEMLFLASRSHLLFLESNYDEAMLKYGPYPYRLKQRIASERGHLSNVQASSFLTSAGFSQTGRPVYLVHISDSNNTPERVASAMTAFNATVCERGKQYTGSLSLD